MTLPIGDKAPLVAVIMGSTSDWETMRHAHETLKEFGVPHECRVVSAHRTPGLMAEFGVPVQSAALNGLDSLLSIVQMPGGIPVATLAIGKAGARNAGLLAVAIVSSSRPEVREKLRAFRAKQTETVLEASLPLEAPE
jgi:5-(carboxyamino)imidazole ribonucleotide mutase